MVLLLGFLCAAIPVANCWRPNEEISSSGAELESSRPGRRRHPPGHNDVVIGTKFVPSCDRLASSIKDDNSEVCDINEFSQRAWMTAFEMECQLNKAQSLLLSVGQRFTRETKEKQYMWQNYSKFWSEKAANVTALQAASGFCEEYRRATTTSSGLITWCDLTECPCKRCLGQMYLQTKSGRRLIVVPQPFDRSVATSYSYDAGGADYRLFNNKSETTHFDLEKINQGLWYANLFDSLEQSMAHEAIFFSKGVQTRLRFKGNDPALILELYSANGSDSGICIGAPNWNVIDKGNRDAYFSGKDKAEPEKVLPYWTAYGKAPTGRSLAVASQVVFDHENNTVGTISVDVNMSTLSRRLLDAHIAKHFYWVVVDRNGRIVVISHHARAVLFKQNLSLSEIWSRTRRCSKKTCSRTPDEALLLKDAMDPSFSGANFSRVLERMFDENTSCVGQIEQMGQETVDFPAKNRRHAVAFCSFGAVPDWGLIVGTPHEDLDEVGHMSLLLPKQPEDGWSVEQKSVDHITAALEISAQDDSVITEEDSKNRRVEARSVTFMLHNDGMIPLPWHVVLPVQNTSNVEGSAKPTEVSFMLRLADELLDKPRVLYPGEKVNLRFNITFNGTTEGNHKETVVVKADDEERRGTCFRQERFIHIKVKLTSRNFILRILREHGRKVLAALVIMCVLACLIPTGLHVVNEFRRKAKKEAEQNRKIEEAQNSVNHVAFPMVIMSATSFKRLGSLVSHEELQRRHEDVWLHTVEDVKAFSMENKIVFVSHQWTAFNSPDPTKTQYRAMLMSIETLMQQEEWREEEVYVWVDYSSIPQKHRGTQTMAINSLTIYASNVAAFVVVAPAVKHADLADMCDKMTYQRRAWCRAEQFSHLLALGSSRMYLAESGVLTPLSQIPDWLEQSKFIFQGDLTCCRRKHEGMTRCDKELLVIPMLGLWSQLCQRCHHERERDDLIAVHRTISEHLHEVFPPTCSFITDNYTEERELFGDLTDRLKKAMAAESV